jgi:NAD(P)-dependent dehydrogenase (short-subunit alcohol dehydrogenase family)
MSAHKNIHSLEGKVIVVTGGTGVLGQAFVNGIAAAGGTPVLLGRNEAVGQARAESVVAGGGSALFVRADVLDSAQLAAARDTVLGRFAKVDGLVNAAGGNVPEGILKPGDDVFNLHIEGMKQALDLNLWGTVLPTQAFGPALAATGRGSVVNISSVTAKRALTRVLGYSMGKAAVDCYTKWMAVEMAARHGEAARINALTPGFFLTSQNRSLLTNPDGSLTERGEKIIRATPFKRFGQPEELVGALVWLLSDASRFVTGADIVVDGGYTINGNI